MAHAKGLPDRQVMTEVCGAQRDPAAAHGLRVVLRERRRWPHPRRVVFSYPGVGLTLQQAALGHDYAVVQALLLVLSVCVLAANFIMDCVYVVLDPRVRSS